jgi:hypothetical protein
MKYLKSAASAGIIPVRWLLLALSYLLRGAADGVDRASAWLDTLRGKLL